MTILLSSTEHKVLVPAISLHNDQKILQDVLDVVKKDRTKSTASLNDDKINQKIQHALLTKLKIMIQETIKYHLFEPNDEVTRQSILNSIKTYLDTIGEFVVICDDMNNPQSEIEQGHINVDVIHVRSCTSIHVKGVNSAKLDA